MWRGLLNLLMVVVLFCAGGSASLFFLSEGYVKVWEDRVASVKCLENLNVMILDAHDYSQTLMETLRTVTNENGLLCERDAKTTRIVAGLEEENMRLKTSLKDAVEMMQEQIEENNDLHEEVDNLRYKINLLEDVIDTLNDIHEKVAESDALQVEPIDVPGPEVAL